MVDDAVEKSSMRDDGGSQQKVPSENRRSEKKKRFVKEREQVDVARRAQMLLAVAQGCGFTKAGKRSGMSHEGVSQLVKRFNQRGLRARMPIRHLLSGMASADADGNRLVGVDWQDLERLYSRQVNCQVTH